MASAPRIDIPLPNGKKYEQPLGLFVNNEFVQGRGKQFSVIDPDTEKEIARIHGASAEDIENAVRAARKAFEGDWGSFSASERSAALYEIAQLIKRDQELLAAIDAHTCGKTYEAALSGDLDEAYNVVRYYAGWADKLQGTTIETDRSKLAYTLHEPLGVCGQIVPWNYPLMMLAWKIAPALACGNTVVLKPAEQTPLSAIYFGQLVKEAGLPAGVVNIVPGLGGETGAALASHPDVDKIAFTGSTATGRAIMKAAAVNLKALTLECGGKSPSIVFADADLDKAVRWCHFGIMDNNGQICTSTSRIYVERKVYQRFIDKFLQYNELHSDTGSPFSGNATNGPLVSKAQFDKVTDYVRRGQEEGAKLLAGGARQGNTGYYLEPTIFADTTSGMSIVDEEIFGPVVSIAAFDDEKFVIAEANNSPYGLAAAVFTENITLGHRVARKLQAGMVWINSSQDSHYAIPFGGYKQSGVGRELGSYAISAYTQVKAVHVNLGE